MSDYQADERLEMIGKRFIEQHHPELNIAAIAYLMKVPDSDKPPKQRRIGKYPPIATARAVPPVWNALTGLNFVVIVDQRYWNLLTLEQQDAVIDHELQHCGRDDGGWYVRDHDVEEFRCILERHGYWRIGLEEFCNAVQQTLPLQPADLAAAVISGVAQACGADAGLGTPTISVDLDKKCRKCRKPGATQGGLCLKCVAGAIAESVH